MTELTAICDGCAKPVLAGTGWLGVRYEDIHQHTRDQKSWDEANPGDVHDVYAFLSGPDPIKWRVYHGRCDPRPDLDAYQIDVERICTWRQLARWTSDLMAKNWLADSDWDDLLRDIADNKGRRLVPVLAAAA